jgi:protein-tyrosine phosphatase
VLEGVLNMRELGGLTAADGRRVRPGAIWRSGHLGEATDADVARLADLDIALVVDFRTDDDIRLDGPDRLPDGVRYVRTPIGDDTGRGAEIRALMATEDPTALEQAFGRGRSLEMATAGARLVVLDEGALDAYRTFVGEVLEHAPDTFLFHCTAGKDRAGWAASILLFALGAADDHVTSHYLESNHHRRVEESLARLAARGVDPDLLRPFVEVRATYLEASVAACEEGWGSVHAYLVDGLGLGDGGIDALRRAYLA